MKTKLLIVIGFFFVIGSNGQKGMSENDFLIEKKESNGETVISFEEKNNCISSFGAPLNDEGQIVNFIESDIISREVLDSLECTIFTKEEILLFEDYRCIANVIVSSTGQIVKVSFSFNIFGHSEKEFFSKISADKLQLFSQKIKEHISFDFSFNHNIKKHGYYNQGFLIFKSLCSEKLIF